MGKLKAPEKGALLAAQDNHLAGMVLSLVLHAVEEQPARTDIVCVEY